MVIMCSVSECMSGMLLLPMQLTHGSHTVSSPQTSTPLPSDAQAAGRARNARFYVLAVSGATVLRLSDTKMRSRA